MKIGYMYGFHAYPPKGGNHTHAYEIVSHIVNSGQRVSVLDDPTMPGVSNLSSAGDQWIAELNRLTDVLCVRVDARHLRKWGALQKIINSNYSRPIFFEINSPSYESLAYSWLGGKDVWDTSDHESLLRRFRRLVHAKRQGPRIALEERFRKKMAKRIHGAVCVSSAIETYAHNMGISNTLVLPNGGPLFSREDIISMRSSAKKKNSQKFIIFYSGSAIYPWQGLDILASVIELAREQEPEFHFILAVNQRIERLSNNDNVTILEALAREEIFRQVCISNVCVSLHPKCWWSPIGFHNSPIKLFEYMALAGTVLVSNHGQMNELINDGVNGYKTANEPLAVFNKLKEIQADQERGKYVGWQAWNDVQEKYNWRYIADKTVDFFRKGCVCEGKG